MLSEYCRSVTFPTCGDASNPEHSEFLVHAADVEGLCQGIDEELVKSTLIMLLCTSGAENEIGLGEWVSIPTTYAGGAKGRPVLYASDIRLTPRRTW